MDLRYESSGSQKRGASELPQEPLKTQLLEPNPSQ